MDFLSYLNAVRKHWWPLMSCAVFTVLGLYVAYANKSNDWTVRGIFGAAAALLFVACYQAWLDERRKRIRLQDCQAPAPTLKEQAVLLSQSILDFVYERIKNAPSVSTPDCLTDDGRIFLRDMRQHDREARALSANERETLEIFEYKYRRTLASAIVSLKNLSLDSSKLDEYVSGLLRKSDPDYTGTSIVINLWIKEVGKQVGALADQIKES